ncbi:MAG: hypothetical protein EBV83_04615 [Verrucomicrobia bacterium]|nr:hypothetical protein [Verrucomicrobiota bacterium]
MNGNVEERDGEINSSWGRHGSGKKEKANGYRLEAGRSLIVSSGETDIIKKRTIIYGRWAAYILSSIFYILNASAEAAPFASWIDVKTECGAVGDGQADDTAAIQKGLDLLRPERATRKILFFPAGSYRITSTLNILRAKHEESQGIGLQERGRK